MRRAAGALVAGAALLAACAKAPATPAKSSEEKAGYNRRELDAPRPGLFTGRDGAWTVYRSDEAAPPPEPEPPKARKTTTLLCARGASCDPPTPE